MENHGALPDLGLPAEDAATLDHIVKVLEQGTGGAGARGGAGNVELKPTFNIVMQPPPAAVGGAVDAPAAMARPSEGLLANALAKLPLRYDGMLGCIKSGLGDKDDKLRRCRRLKAIYGLVHSRMQESYVLSTLVCADAVQGPTAYWDGLLQNLPEAQRQSVLGAHAEGGILSQNVDDDDEFDLDDD